MNKGYEEKISFKTRVKQKLMLLKYKKISITFLISLASLYLAMIITFSIVYTSYKQTHPYTAQEISELTSIVYVLPYVDDSATQYYVEQETTTDSSQELETEIEDTTQEETTNQDIQETITTETTTTLEEATTLSTTQATTTAQTQTTTATTQTETTNSTTTTTKATTTTQAATTTTTTTVTTTTSSSILSTSLDINALVYVTASGTKFHFASCSYLSSDKIEKTYGEVLELEYTPCSRCFPDG